jgi:type IV secretory pathway TrbD component
MKPTNVLAIRKPKLIVGVERRMLGVSFMLPVIVCANSDSWTSRFIAVGLFVGCCALSTWLTRKDDRFPEIITKTWRQKAIYDPGKRA